MSASAICVNGYREFSNPYSLTMLLIEEWHFRPMARVLHLWQMKEEKIQIPPSSDSNSHEIKAMSFGACGNLLATIGEDHSLRLWDLDGPQPHQRLVHKRKTPVSWDTVALSPDGTKLATGFRDGAFTLWQITPSGLRVLAEYNRGGTILAFAPDSKTLFSSAGFGVAKVIDVSKPKETAATLDARRPGGQFAIKALAVSPDGKTIALGGGWDIELWHKTDSGWEKRTDFRVNGDVKALSFGGRGGNTLLVGGGSHQKPQVNLFDVQGDKPAWITDFTGLREEALSVTASSTDQMFAATDATGRVVVWSATGKKLHEWTFPGPVRCVSFAPDGRHLALGNGDGTVYILRLGAPASK
jgi:WD40 repeat protein